MEFPFEKVFDHFAKPLDGKVVGEDQWKPSMYCVYLAGGEVAGIEELPVAQFFGSNQGKAALGGVIRTILGYLPSAACLVLTSEAWLKREVLAPGALRHDRSRSLEHDPAAQVALMFHLYHRSGQQVGWLPLGPGRVLAYQPLNLDMITGGGRLTLQPDRDVEQEAIASGTMADAAVKHAARNV